jgi:hypothetical protein
MQRTNINPEIFQAMLDCAPNAAAKGQSQFFNPTDFGRSLTLPGRRLPGAPRTDPGGRFSRTGLFKSTRSRMC